MGRMMEAYDAAVWGAGSEAKRSGSRSVDMDEFSSLDMISDGLVRFCGETD